MVRQQQGSDSASWVQVIAASAATRPTTTRASFTRRLSLRAGAAPEAEGRQHDILSHISRHPALVPEEAGRAIEACCAGLSNWPLVLMGAAGTGKTCACLCLVDHCENAAYLTWPSLIQWLRDAQDGNATWWDEGRGGDLTPQMIWESLFKRRLVVVDEIGTRSRATDWQLEQCLTLLDGRQGRPLVLAGNFTLKGLEEQFDYRVVSRLLRATNVALAGPDLRDPRAV